MQTGGPTTTTTTTATTTTITSTLFDTKINKPSQSINQSVNAPREPTPTPTPTEHTHTPTPLRSTRRTTRSRRRRRRRISRGSRSEGSMFQALATLSLLLATATATANTDADAAAQLQAETTGTGLAGSAATPFGSKQLTRCRQSCYQQFARDWHYCTDFVDCRNCWQNCQRQLAPFELRVHHAQRQGALVLTDIGWDELIANASRQCLITWEVSGGGLMGNLLTDTARAELSLWPDTVYNIQVTCKHKLTGLMRRSLKLNVDTHQLVSSAALLLPDGTSTRTNNRRTIASRLQPVSISATSKTTNRATGAAAGASSSSSAVGAQHVLVHPTDRVYIISSLPTASQLSGVVYPAFGALAFFLALLVMFLFLRPQRKRATEDAASDTASLLSTARRGSRLSTTLDNSTLHV